MKRALIAALAAILAPGAGMGQPAAARKAAPQQHAGKRADSRKTIGLVSEIGDKFTVRKIGIMVFGNEETAVPIDNWGVDALVGAKLTALVKARFNVIPLKLSKEAVASLDQAPSKLFGDRDGYICNVLRKTGAQSFDYYVRVGKTSAGFGNTNQFLKGLGIVHREGLDTGYTYVHALFEIEVLNGQTCEVLRRERAANSGQETLVAYIGGPTREVDASWMPAPQAAAQDAKLRDATRSLVEWALTQTVPLVLSTE